MSEPSTIIKNDSMANNDLRLKDIIVFLRKNILILVGVSILAAALGIAYSFSLPKMYESEITLLPEYGALRKNSFASLLSPGLSGDGAEKLIPELYPTILQSSLLGIYLLKQPVIDENNNSYKSLELFLQKDSKPGLFSRLFSSSPKTEIKSPPKIPGTINYSPGEEGKIAGALGLIRSEIDLKNGVITITATTTDPVVSAIVVQASNAFLVNYVEDYRTAKATQQVEMLSGQVIEARKRLRNSEMSLQSYRDRNRNPFLNVARIEEQRLQAEYILAESLYGDLVRKYEQARIKVKEEKPVFKVIEPAKISLNKSSPKRLRIGLITGFIGGFLCFLYVIFIKENLLAHAFEEAYLKK